MHTPPPSPVDLSFLYQLKSDGKTSGDFIDRLSQDSVPITISACVDSIILANSACFPGVLMDWHLIIKTLSGRSFLFVSTLDGDDVAFDSSRYEKEFAVLHMLVLNRLVKKVW
jgi:hypothetical protein